MKKKKKITKKELKEKQEKTLNKMKEIRKQDSIFLRKIIKGKLEYAEEQTKKVKEAIDMAKKSIEQNTITLHRLIGMKMVLGELLEDDKETKKEDK